MFAQAVLQTSMSIEFLSAHIYLDPLPREWLNSADVLEKGMPPLRH